MGDSDACHLEFPAAPETSRVRGVLRGAHACHDATPVGLCRSSDSSISPARAVEAEGMWPMGTQLEWTMTTLVIGLPRQVVVQRCSVATAPGKSP